MPGCIIASIVARHFENNTFVARHIVRVQACLDPAAEDMSIWIYIYIYMYTYIHIYIYIHMYIFICWAVQLGRPYRVPSAAMAHMGMFFSELSIYGIPLRRWLIWRCSSLNSMDTAEAAWCNRSLWKRSAAVVTSMGLLQDCWHGLVVRAADGIWQT